MKRKVTVNRLKQIKALILGKASHAILLGEVGALLDRLDSKDKWAKQHALAKLQKDSKAT